MQASPWKAWSLRAEKLRVSYSTNVIRRCRLLEELADPIGPMLADSTSNPTIVDCVAMTTFQFSAHVYGLDLLKDHPLLCSSPNRDAYLSKAGPTSGLVKTICCHVLCADIADVNLLAPLVIPDIVVTTYQCALTPKRA